MSSLPSRREQRSHPLTRDNTLLSRPKNRLETATCNADPQVDRYIQESVSANTRRAYRFDLAHFQAWGGSLPSNSTEIARYLAHHGETLSPATLARRVATLSKVHTANGWQNPCRSDIVKNTLKGVRRVRGTVQHQAKPLLREDLFCVLDSLDQSVKSARDRTLLLLGWAGGMRASEIVGLNKSDVETVQEGLVLHLRHSKTDQEGKGRSIGIPFGRTRHCPVAALRLWSEGLTQNDAALFRPIDRRGLIGTTRLRPDAVSLILRNCLHVAGLTSEGFSGHSLRAGLVTSATKAGVQSYKIRQQTGHTSDVMLARYVRDAEMFEGNAVLGLL